METILNLTIHAQGKKQSIRYMILSDKTDYSSLIRSMRVADYCVERRNDSTWFVEGVQRYHRMFSTIVNTLVDNGLYILKVVEPYPTEGLVQKHPEYYDLFHQPDFLFIKAVKHAAM